MAEEPKGQKHYYVPVFYLKQWMVRKNTVCEFSRPYDRVKTRSPHPDGTGYVRGLYAIDDLDPNVVNAIEDMFLKPSDGMAAEALHCLLREVPFTHPERMRHAWTRFILSLLIRYPEAIAQMKKHLLTGFAPEIEGENQAPRQRQQARRCDGLSGIMLPKLLEDILANRLRSDCITRPATRD